MVSLARIPRVLRRAVLLLLLGQPLLQSALADSPRFLGQNSAGPQPAIDGASLDSPTRFKINLNGEWKYLLDGKEQGTVSIPSSYDEVAKVEFRRFFDLRPEQIDQYRFHLVMYGSNYSTDILVNGEYVGHHDGGYTGFVQTLPQVALHPGGENLIQVYVNNALDGKNTLPTRQLVWGWRNYGGVHRDIFLLATPHVYIKDASYTADVSDDLTKARVFARATIESEENDRTLPSGSASGLPLAVSCELVDRLTGEVIGKSSLVPLQQGEERLLTVSNEISLSNPRLWSPDSPELYILKWSLVRTSGAAPALIDEYQVTCGIRQVALHKGDFQINGRRLVLKGVMWYEDQPGQGNAISTAGRERDIEMIKNLGANVVRFASHPPHPAMLDLCDRYGLMAMVDLPLSSAPSSVILAEPYQELVTGTLREMITRDRNHACVLAWGLGTGLATSDTALRPFVASLVRTAHALDSRFTYLPTRLVENDTCSSLVDLAAVELSAGDQKFFRQELELWRARHATQPIILSEFGQEVEHDNLRGYNDWYSQQSQARFFLQRLEIARVLDYDGAIVWSFNDWEGDRPALTAHVEDPWLHSMGLVSGLREKRVAYEAVRSVFRGEKIGALPAGTFSGGAPIVYVLAGFVVLVAAAYLYNANRRFREHLNRSVFSSYNFFADLRDQHAVSFWHTTILGALIAVATAMVLSSIFYHYRSALFLDNMLSTVLMGDGVKAVMIRLIRDPLRFLLVMSPLIYVLMVLTSGVVHLLRFPLKKRIEGRYGYSAVIWSAAPLLAFIPLGMILYRLMESKGYVLPLLALVGIFFAWVFLRLVKGIAIMYDVFPPKAYAVAFLGVLVAGGIVYAYYDIVDGGIAYLTFLYSIR